MAEKEQGVVPPPAWVSEAGEGLADTERVFQGPFKCLLLSKEPGRSKQARTRMGQEDDGG